MSINEKEIEVLFDIIVGVEQGYHIAPSKERIAVLHKAIDTMRKYQKIEEILKDDYEKDCGDKADFFRIGDIRMTINGESR